MFMLRLGKDGLLVAVPAFLSMVCLRGISSAFFGTCQAPFSSGCLSGLEIPLAGSHQSEPALLLASEQRFLSTHPDSRPALPTQLSCLKFLSELTDSIWFLSWLLTGLLCLASHSLRQSILIVWLPINLSLSQKVTLFLFLGLLVLQELAQTTV